MKLKYMTCISFLFLILTLTTVAASDNTTTDAFLSEPQTNTFNDLQVEIDNSEENVTLEIEGNYAGSGSEINISKSITLDGKGSAIIDANGLSRALNINSKNVILQNIMFINGNASGNGGAILSSCENLTIINCTFINNIAYNTGGAFYSTNKCNLQLVNSSFINNSAQFSGVFEGYYQKSLIDNNLFYGNYAERDSAVFSIGSDFTLTNCEFKHNKAGGKYITIKIEYTCNNALIKNCLFESNSMSEIIMSEVYGGAIYSNSNNLTIMNTTFRNNSATYFGGAIYHDGGIITVINSTFVDNVARDGGAIFSYRSNGALIDCNFISNKAIDLIYDYNPSGGALIWRSSNGLIKNCIFNNNTSKYIGSAMIIESDNTTIDSCEFKNHDSSEFVVIKLYGSNISLINSNFTDKSEWEFEADVDNLTLDNDNFIGTGYLDIADKDLDNYNNYALVNNTNFIGIRHEDSPLNLRGGTVSNCNFINNSGHYGGALNGADLVINSLFDGNSAEYVGAYYVYATDSTAENIRHPSIINCTFKNNKAKNFAGATYCHGYGIIIINSTFINNNAGTYSGAVLIEGKNALLENDIFINNTAKDYGGAISSYNLNNKAINLTFINNNAPKFADALYFKQEISGYNLYYGDYLSVRLIDVITNEPVPNIKINVDIYKGGDYSLSGVTDSHGIAKIQILCTPKVYCISIGPENMDDIMSNNFTVSKAPANLSASALTTVYNSANKFTAKLVNIENNNPINGDKLALKVYTGSKCKVLYATTNVKGIASFDVSSVDVGTHKVEVYSTTSNVQSSKVTSKLTVTKAKTIVTAPKVIAKYKKSAYFKVTVKDKTTKKVVKNVAVKIKVYTGQKSKVYTLKTNAKGIASLNSKTLSRGTHKVVITSGNSNYIISATSSIKIK